MSSIQDAVRFALPHWASVVVINRGDPAVLHMLDSESHSRWEFPPRDAGRDNGELIAELERLRAEGWDYLLVPAAAFEWLDRHEQFKRHIEREYGAMLRLDACALFRLDKPEATAAATAPDGLPVPPPEMVGLSKGTMSPESFYESGASTASWIAEMLLERGTSVDELDRILDFGCGCGRVIRHWKGTTRASLHGTDYNPYQVAWCRANLTFAEFEVNDVAPPLRYEPGTFDFVYALSVFTHLGESLQVPWMTELTRLLRPGGVLLLTLHGRRYLDWLDPEEAARFEAGQLVVREPDLSGSSFCAAFHPERYVREVLGRHLDLVAYAIDPARDDQDAVLFAKR